MKEAVEIVSVFLVLALAFYGYTKTTYYRGMAVWRVPAIALAVVDAVLVVVWLVPHG